MSCDLATAARPGYVYRVARAPAWAWPEWSRAHPDGTFGHRWDDPRGVYRVLYASATRFGALLETLAPLRPALEAVARVAAVVDTGGDTLRAGVVPREWFRGRRIGIAELAGSYADIGAATSLATLRSRLAAQAIHYGLPDVDAAVVRLAAPRGFTQAISRLVYECRSLADSPFAGIRYYSRLDDETLNWAIFEPPPGATAPIHPVDGEPFDPEDPSVSAALDVLGLRLG